MRRASYIILLFALALLLMDSGVVPASNSRSHARGTSPDAPPAASTIHR